MKLPIEYFRQNIFHKKNIEFPTNIYSVENIHWKVEITNWYFIDRFDSVGNLNNSDGFLQHNIHLLEIKIPQNKSTPALANPSFALLSPCVFVVVLCPPPSPSRSVHNPRRCALSTIIIIVVVCGHGFMRDLFCPLCPIVLTSLPCFA